MFKIKNRFDSKLINRLNSYQNLKAMIYFILKIGADLNIAQTPDTLTEAIKTGIQTIETSPQITETKISLITMIAKVDP